jgi:hypothetical protein
MDDQTIRLALEILGADDAKALTDQLTALKAALSEQSTAATKAEADTGALAESYRALGAAMQGAVTTAGKLPGSADGTATEGPGPRARQRTRDSDPAMVAHPGIDPAAGAVGGPAAQPTAPEGAGKLGDDLGRRAADAATANLAIARQSLMITQQLIGEYQRMSAIQQQLLQEVRQQQRQLQVTRRTAAKR